MLHTILCPKHMQKKLKELEQPIKLDHILIKKVKVFVRQKGFSTSLSLCLRLSVKKIWTSKS